MNIEIIIFALIIVILSLNSIKGYKKGDRYCKYKLLNTLFFYVVFLVSSIFINTEKLLYKYNLIEKIKDLFSINFLGDKVNILIIYMCNVLFKVIYFLLLKIISSILFDFLYKKVFKNIRIDKNKGLLLGLINGFINCYLLLCILNYNIRLIPLNTKYINQDINDILIDYNQSFLQDLTNIKINGYTIDKSISYLFTLNKLNDKIVCFSNELDIFLNCMINKDDLDLIKINMLFSSLSKSDLIDELSNLIFEMLSFNNKFCDIEIDYKKEFETLAKLSEVLLDYNDSKFNILVNYLYNLQSFDLLVYYVSIYSIDKLFYNDVNHLESIKTKLAVLANNRKFHDDLTLLNYLYENYIIEANFKVDEPFLNYIFRFNFVNELYFDVIKIAIEKIDFPFKEYIDVNLIDKNDLIIFYGLIKDVNINVDKLSNSKVFQNALMSYLINNGYEVSNENNDLYLETNLILNLFIIIKQNYDSTISLYSNVINIVNKIDLKVMLESNIIHLNISNLLTKMLKEKFDISFINVEQLLLEKKDIISFLNNIENIYCLVKGKTLTIKQINDICLCNITKLILSNYIFNINNEYISAIQDVYKNISNNYLKCKIINTKEMRNLLSFVNEFNINKDNFVNNIVSKKDNLIYYINPKSSKYSKIVHSRISLYCIEYLKKHEIIDICYYNNLLNYKDIISIVDILHSLLNSNYI